MKKQTKNMFQLKGVTNARESTTGPRYRATFLADEIDARALPRGIYNLYLKNLAKEAMVQNVKTIRSKNYEYQSNN